MWLRVPFPTEILGGGGSSSSGSGDEGEDDDDGEEEGEGTGEWPGEEWGAVSKLFTLRGRACCHANSR